MSKRLFIKKFITNNKQTGAILPSSIFLAKKMINKQDLLNSNTIIELGAGSGIFTKRIFNLLGNEINNKKIFIIEKDIEFYNLLLKRFPEYSQFIYNIDILDINKILKKEKITSIDLIISGLPFKSLPKEIFTFLIEDFLPKVINKNTKFIQFSYFSNFAKVLGKYFKNIEIKKCILNIPSAYVFSCSNFIEKNEKK